MPNPAMEGSHANKANLDVIALSSFLPNGAVAGLTDDQLARLESFLGQVRRKTYELLVEAGRSTRLSDGTIRIEIPAQDAMVSEMLSHVDRGVAEIVGSERMKALQKEMGPKFQAKFGYFGRYDTTMSITIDQVTTVPDAPAYVTMRSEYHRVVIGGAPAGTVRSTTVDRKIRFESSFFSVDQVAARI